MMETAESAPASRFLATKKPSLGQTLKPFVSQVPKPFVLRAPKPCLACALLLSVLGPARAANHLQVASFSTVLTEIARQVGGDRVTVFGLVRPGVDPHEYEPTPADLRKVSEARVILTSGRQLEDYLGKLQQASGGKADLLPVGDRLTTSAIHWWNSVGNVEEATRIVRDELSKVDPADQPIFEKNASDYLVRLDDLNRWIRRKVAELPRDRRRLVTSHNAFRALGHAYGFTIFAIEGTSTETEPSNRQVAKLIDQIKSQGVKAIFVEQTQNPKVTQEIARETGAKIGGALYADGLGTGEASTYAGMMKHNVSTIVNALK
jgi:ABC-type Zn uptake system ZnuABC Zn-binding protein ZnuA